MRIKIIGVGSPFNDDNIAQTVVENLVPLSAIRQNSKHNIECLYLDRPGVKLLTQLEDVDYLIIVDAVVTDGPAGEIIQLGVDEITDESSLRFSGHQIGIRESLALAKALKCLPNTCKFFGVSINSNRSEESCTIANQALARMIVAEIKAL